MTAIAQLAAGASGAAAVLALALAYLALRAWRATRSQRNLFLSAAFVVAAVQAIATGVLLASAADIAAPWLAVPLAHALTLVLMYVALLRV